MTMVTALARPGPARTGTVRLPGRGLVLGVLGLLLFLGVWELVSGLGLVDPRYLPRASTVLVTFAQNLSFTSFWVAIGLTLRAWILGLAIAVVGGCVVGVLIGSSRFLRRATSSTIEFLRPIPSVGLIPLAVLTFGIQLQSELMLIVYACFWQVLIQVLSGVGDVDRVADDTMRTLRLSHASRIRHLVWPTTLPYLMTGVRLAATVALILAVTAELIIGTPGLGSEVANAQANGAIASMYALILASGLVGVGVNVALRLVERRVLFWHPSVRGEAAG